MKQRSVEDHLREEYFELLPGMGLVAEELEVEVRHSLLPISSTLDRYEQIVVTSRLKDCESAVGKLRRQQEGGTFDIDRPDPYTLTDLSDLAGVHVLAVPSVRVVEVDRELQKRFANWTPDPFRTANTTEDILGFKYHGLCDRAVTVRGELQVLPMLIGLFWQVEHSAIYNHRPH